MVGGNPFDEDVSSAEVIDLETSATTCNIFPSLPSLINGGVGGLGFQNEPWACQGTK